ncbi:conserved hypothetical protein [Candidatus Desulfosporosinus infrequens]|uniref:Uncharacterized protein n=1 Tax=Candidatus Desulfosporosinus infrequens TaxID=2043169 RepID=A0A2U3LMH0_9FIRM|nr:conserved hypothetical protein [Candidatus Desulfosporosinus infrequens]
MRESQSQSFFIPLYFDEAEADLWLALQQIEPEKRTAFIKATLRQVLLAENEVETPIGTAHLLKDDIVEDEMFSTVEEETFSIVEDETFSLEALFSQGTKPTLHTDPWDSVDEQNEHLDRAGEQDFDLESLNVDTTLPSTGFEYMMRHIIGTEDDEVILKILRGSQGES